MTMKCTSSRVKTCVACCCTAGALAFSTPAIAGPKPKNPILVELFTSQNCPACPAANEKLIELSKSDTIFPLTWSVSYWDYLGEKDPFAQPEFNKRQRKYADHFNLRAPFTPQAVVDGCVQTSGRVSFEAVKEKIDHAMTPHGYDVNFSVKSDSLHLSRKDKLPSVDVLLVGYLPGITAVVPSKGANKNKMMSHVNMVTSVTELGTWAGDSDKEIEFTCRDEACVVILQESVSRDVMGFGKVPAVLPEG